MNEDITCPIANSHFLYVTAKSYKDYIKAFTETLTSNSYTLKLIVEKDVEQNMLQEGYELKRISNTQSTLHKLETCLA